MGSRPFSVTQFIYHGLKKDRGFPVSQEQVTKWYNTDDVPDEVSERFFFYFDWFQSLPN